MKDLKTIKALVKWILEKSEKSRNNDNYLYLLVCTYIGDKFDCDLAKVSVEEFFENLSESAFPPFESVRRTRQKLQAENPHLAASDRVKAMRDEQEMEYWSYATGKGVHP